MRFRLLYVLFVIRHGRRHIAHFNVTEHPAAAWVVQQLREAFPFDLPRVGGLHHRYEWRDAAWTARPRWCRSARFPGVHRPEPEHRRLPSADAEPPSEP